MFKDNFTANLRLQSRDQLVDSGAGVDQGGDLTFKPMINSTRLAGEASEGVGALVEPLRVGDVNRFINQSLLEGVRNTPGVRDLLNTLYEQLLRRFSGRSNVEARYLNRVNLGQGIQAREGVWITNEVRLVDGSVGAEYMLLLRENNQWLIYAIYYD
jgi:hypothetical protein